jgi:hypothetical protein
VVFDLLKRIAAVSRKIIPVVMKIKSRAVVNSATILYAIKAYSHCAACGQHFAVSASNQTICEQAPNRLLNQRVKSDRTGQDNRARYSRRPLAFIKS